MVNVLSLKPQIIGSEELISIMGSNKLMLIGNHFKQYKIWVFLASSFIFLLKLVYKSWNGTSIA